MVFKAATAVRDQQDHFQVRFLFVPIMFIIFILFLCFIIANDASAPTNVMANALSGPVGIRVSWTAPTLPTGLPITGYSIQYRIRGMSDSTYVTVTVGAGTTQRDITGLQSNTEYRTRVATRTNLGTGSYCCQTTALYVKTGKSN